MYCLVEWLIGEEFTVVIAREHRNWEMANLHCDRVREIRKIIAYIQKNYT